MFTRQRKIIRLCIVKRFFEREKQRSLKKGKISLVKIEGFVLKEVKKGIDGSLTLPRKKL